MNLMEALLNLHRVDAQVRGLRQRLNSAERFLNAQQTKLDAVEVEKRELEARRRQMQAKVHNAETEIAALNERIDKHRDELNKAETNKEYTALLSEINTLKAEKSEIENSVLGEMEQTEVMGSEIELLTGQIEDRSKQRDVAKAQLEERKAEVGDRLVELEAERSIAANSVPMDALAVFDEMAESYDGEPMSAIETIDRRNREYACGACNMHLPFETVSSLFSRSDSLIRCSVCKRILYMQDETRGAMAGKK